MAKISFEDYHDTLVHYWDPVNDLDVSQRALAHCGRRGRVRDTTTPKLAKFAAKVTCEACILLKLAAFVEGRDFITGMRNYYEYRSGKDKIPELTILAPDHD